MKTNHLPPHHTQARSAAQQPREIRFKAADLEKAIDFLPHEEQAHILALFPRDATGHWMKADELRYNLAMERLYPEEQEALESVLKTSKMSIKYSQSFMAQEAAMLKDSGRFTPVPTPEARQPAKGEDLKAPIGSHGAGPNTGAQDADLYPLPGSRRTRTNAGAQGTALVPQTSSKRTRTNAGAQGAALVPQTSSKRTHPDSGAQDVDLYPPPGSKDTRPEAGAKDAGLKLPPGTNGMRLLGSAKNADLKLPPSALGMSPPGIVKHAELKLPVVVPKKYLSSPTQTQLPVPSGKAQGKPKPEAANSYVAWADLIGVDQSGKKTTLADLFAANRPSQNTPGSQQDQTSPLPSKRVTFATQAQVQEFSPKKKIASSQTLDSVHEVNFGPKNPPVALPKEDTASKIAKKLAVVGAAGVAVGAIMTVTNTVGDPSSNAPDQT